MHINASVLKSWESPAGDIRRPAAIEFHLMAPAFEPTLLARISATNRKGEVVSLQFVPADDGDLHFVNLPFDPAFPPKRRIESVILADLPLRAEVAWRVAMVQPRGGPEYIGHLFRSRHGLWHYVPLRPTEAEQRPLGTTIPRIMFVGGPPKSGTTWVQRILNSHPDALATGENNFFGWPYPPALMKLMEATPPPWFAHAAPKQAPFRAQVVHMHTGRTEGILSQIADIAQVQLAVDKSPGNDRHLANIMAARPRWRYLNCLRNPLDIAVSRFFHERATLANTPDISLLRHFPHLQRDVLAFDAKTARPGDMFGDRKLLDAIIDHSLAGSDAISFAQSDPDRVKLIYYEDMLSDPAREITAIYTFCGLSTPPALIAGVVKANRFEAYSGGRKPGKADPSSFYRKGISGDHLNYLTPDQIAYATGRVRERTPHFDRYFN